MMKENDFEKFNNVIKEADELIKEIFTKMNWKFNEKGEIVDIKTNKVILTKEQYEKMKKEQNYE